MQVSNLTLLLSSLVGVFSAVAAGIGLFVRGEGEPFTFTTLRGQEAKIYGRGLYRYDSLFIGAGYKGQDTVVLAGGVPLLALSVVLYERGTLIGQLMLTGVLGYFLYIYASMALGAAYNRLFLLYTMIFSLGLYTFLQLFSSVNTDAIAAAIPAGLPREALAAFMIVAGAVTLVVWGGPMVAALLKDGPPDRLDSYTTIVTYALDLAVITPATFLCAIQVLGDEPLGYVIAAPLLTIIILLAPQILLSTLFQRSAGVPFTRGEMIGPVAGFLVLGLIAVWIFVQIISGVSRVG